MKVNNRLVSNPYPKILVIGSSLPSALESVYKRALSRISFARVELFDVDQFKIVVPSTKTFARIANRCLSHFSDRRIEDALLKFLRSKREGYDAIFVFKGMEFSRKTLDLCYREQPNAIWVNINPDDPFNIGSRGSTNTKVLESLSFFDIYCIWSRDLVSKLYAHGCKRVEYLPFGYDIELHTKQTDVVAKRSGKVAFVGAWDQQREKTLSRLAPYYNLEVYGSNWGRVSKHSKFREDQLHSQHIFGAKLVQIIAEANASLNLLRPQNYKAHNMRTFEIPAMGGVMVTRRSQEQNEWFPEGEACLMYESVDELQEKLKWIFANLEAAERIRANGIALVKDHSYDKRAEQLLSIIFAEAFENKPVG